VIFRQFQDKVVRAYAPVAGAGPAAEVPVAASFPIGVDRPDSVAVSPDLLRAVYATPEFVACVDERGAEAWRFELGPALPRPGGLVACAYALDGATVWVYAPDAMARGAGPDRWLALDAGTGRIVAAAELPTAGQGASQFAHPDGVHVLLDVAEGQDGACLYRGRLEGGRIEVDEYDWSDRTMVALSPDGRHFMTVEHGQDDAAFHAYPDGSVVARVSVEALGHDPGDAFVEWIGGYVDPATAVVTVVGEDEDEEEWFRRYLVSPHTGAVLAPLDTPSRDVYDIEPLGDGTWLTTEGGRVRRHAR
jgi:hypothetical protein